MQPIFSVLGQAFRKSMLALGLTIFISVSGLLFVVQSSYAVSPATNKLTPEQKIDRAYEYGEGAGLREEKRQEAYEEAVKEAGTPDVLEKDYEKAEKAYEQANPGPGLVEQAKGLVDKVTGKD